MPHVRTIRAEELEKGEYRLEFLLPDRFVQYSGHMLLDVGEALKVSPQAALYRPGESSPCWFKHVEDSPEVCAGLRAEVLFSAFVFERSTVDQVLFPRWSTEFAMMAGVVRVVNPDNGHTVYLKDRWGWEG